jgi:hypothetical protein
LFPWPLRRSFAPCYPLHCSEHSRNKEIQFLEWVTAANSAWMEGRGFESGPGHRWSCLRHPAVSFHPLPNSTHHLPIWRSSLASTVFWDIMGCSPPKVNRRPEGHVASVFRVEEYYE